MCRLPFKAAVDVCAIAKQDHDAPLHTVKVLLEQLKNTRVGWEFYTSLILPLVITIIFPHIIILSRLITVYLMMFKLFRHGIFQIQMW